MISVLSLPERAFTLADQSDFQNPQPSLEAMVPFLDFLERNLPSILFSLPKNKLFLLGPGSVSQKSTSPIRQLAP